MKLLKYSILIICLVLCSVCFFSCDNEFSNPPIEINSDGYWVINGVVFNVKAAGADGKDGATPTIEINEDGYWVINGVITDIRAENNGSSNIENLQELDFYLQDDGTYAVAVGNAKCLSKIDIPSTYKGKIVTAIADSGFSKCTNLKNISIPKTVINIGDLAFFNCGELTSINFDGTKAQWEAIIKASNWGHYIGEYIIYCTDGNIVGNIDGNNSEFITASGTSYILHPVKVREKAKNSSATIGTADWGAAVELVERNNTWTKIKFTDTASGAILEGYVRNELLTGDKKAVTKVDLDVAVAAKIVNLGNKSDGTPITLNVRTTPWNSSESTEYKNVNVLSNISNKKYSVQDGDDVEKLATTEDGKWVYIKFTKTVDGVETPQWGWCVAQYVSAGGEPTDTPVDANTPPAVAPIE